MSEEPESEAVAVELRDVRCSCGEKLVDAVAPPDVRVGDETIPFRRTTDFLVCLGCRSMYRVTDVGSELVASHVVVEQTRDA